jgi:large subunit ribosomal protein L30
MTKIIAIRIRGTVDVPQKQKQTFELLRLRRKFAAVVIEKNPVNLGMVNTVKDYIAYGEISSETLKQLLMKRGKKEGDKPLEIAGKLLDEFVIKFIENKAKLEDIKLKPFFRLHPPIGGFKGSIRVAFPRGVLGYYGDKINPLVQKML